MMDVRFLASTYRPNAAVSTFSTVPTFGHTTKITDIFSVDGGLSAGDNYVDYIRGTLFIPGLCLSLLLLWIVILIVCKILGRRVGILAGYPVDQENDEAKKRCGTGPILVSTASLIIACMGVMFLVKGAESAQNVFEDIYNGASELKVIEDLVVSSTDKAIALGESTLSLKDSLLFQLELDGGICNPSDTSFEFLATSINTQAQVVVQSLTDLQDFAKNDLTSIRKTFDEDFGDYSGQLMDAADTGEKYSKPMYIAAPIVFFGLIFGIGGLLAWRLSGCKPYFCIQTWVLLPIFILLIVFVAVLAAVSSVVLKVNADICLGGESKTPEGTVEILVEEVGLDGVTLEALNYYIINSCEGEFSQKDEIDGLVTDLFDGGKELESLQGLLSGDNDIADKCGLDADRLLVIENLLDTTIKTFSDFEDVAVTAKDILDCERINSVFVAICHDAICTSSPTTFLWIYCTMSIVFVLGMFIILFRGALLPPVPIDGLYENVYSNEQEDGRSGAGQKDDEI